MQHSQTNISIQKDLKYSGPVFIISMSTVLLYLSL